MKNQISFQEELGDLFESVTEEEIRHLLRSRSTNRGSEDEAWAAICVNLMLDIAFKKTKFLRQIEH